MLALDMDVLFVLHSNFFSCDVVNLKFSDGKKSSTDPGLVNTIGRSISVTYRFNVGLLTFTVGKARDLTDRKNWVSKICVDHVLLKINLISQPNIWN